MAVFVNGAETTTVDKTFVENLLRITEDEYTWYPLHFPADLNDVTVAGTGNGEAAPRRLNAATGTTSSSGYTRRMGTNNFAWFKGIQNNLINWSKRIIFVIRFQTSTERTTNGVSRILLGPTLADGAKALDDKGIGIEVRNAALYAAAHDGSSDRTADAGEAMTENITYTVVITSDGSGNVEWFLDGTSTHSISNGPTGNSTANHNNVNVQTENNSDSASHKIEAHEILVGFVQ